MRTSTRFHVTLVLAGLLAWLGLGGCGYGPLAQPYAVESGAEPVTDAIGQDTELPQLMAQMRLAKLNLADQLTANSPQQAVQAASRVVMLARDMSTYQPAIALNRHSDAATFKRLMHDVQDMGVECAKSADGGQMGLADRYYVRVYLKYNEWRRLHMSVPSSPTEPWEIPELESVQAPAPAAEPTTPTPAPPTPAPAVPAPAVPAPAVPAPEVPAPAVPAPATPAPETPVDTDKALREAKVAELQGLIKKMRPLLLHLADRLSTGAPEQAVQAAVAVSMQARKISQYEIIVRLPADAEEEAIKAAEEEKAAFKRSMIEVQGLAVECAKAASAGDMANGDQYYARLYLSYNQWKRFFVAAPVMEAPEEMPIPKPYSGDTDTTPEGGATTPEGGMTPGGEVPRPPVP